MRSVFILGLFVSLCAPACAATRHQPRYYHANARMIIHSPNERAVPPGWYSFPGYPPIPPEENRNLDPSNFGGE